MRATYPWRAIRCGRAPRTRIPAHPVPILPTMQVVESGKRQGLFGRAYTLGLTIAPGNEAQLVLELADVGGAVGPWIAKRGKGAARVQLTVVATDPVLDLFEARLRALLDRELLRTLGGRPLLVSAFHPDGTWVRDGTLGG